MAQSQSKQLILGAALILKPTLLPEKKDLLFFFCWVTNCKEPYICPLSSTEEKKLQSIYRYFLDHHKEMLMAFLIFFFAKSRAEHIMLWKETTHFRSFRAVHAHMPSPNNCSPLFFFVYVHFESRCVVWQGGAGLLN